MQKCVSGDGPLGLSPELLASLQSLGENSDYTLLPHSLHQIAEAYSLKEDYQWAIQFLQLEKLYHERLLSNLTALQENWGTACILFFPLKNITNGQKPTCSSDREQEQNMNSESSQTEHQEGGREEDGEEEEETYEEGQEVEEEEPCEETPEEEEVKVEWPTGVPQASDKDLAKLSHTEGVGIQFYLLVCILHLCFISYFIDEVGGDSCLILLLLCLVTVVISIGGTALYCTLVDTYSNICTDFTHNVDFYVMNIRRFFEGLGHWLGYS
uniref:Consortin, connexin sorting protein b n=1 Tax=Lates calcarifer TaxID=8187 RepID=A0A4W6CHS7_LATCA